MMAGPRRLSPIDLLSSVGILVGLAIAIYLTVVHYQESLLVCGVGGDCHTVQQSSYATVGPVPVALLGVALMATLMLLWVVRSMRQDLRMAVTGISFALLLTAVASEGYLTYVEIWVLEAICQWCVAFAVTLLVLLVAESVRLWQMAGDLD